MAEADIPTSWPNAGRNVLGNSLWILPLLTGERLFEGHLAQGVIAAAAWFVALVLAVKLHVLQELIASRERQRQLLTWAFILSGACLLTAGIFRLSSTATVLGGAAPDDLKNQLRNEQSARTTLDKQLAATRSELQAVLSQRDSYQAEAQRLKQEASNPPARMPQAAPDGSLFFAPGPVLKRKLIRKEAEELISILNELNDMVRPAVNLPVPAGVFEPVSQLAIGGHRWPSQIKENGLTATMDSLKQFKTAARTVADDLQKTVSTNSRYKNELISIVGNVPIENFERTIDQYVGTIEKLSTEVPDASIWMLSLVLHEPASRANVAVQEFRAWALFFTNQRSPNARAELEAFL